jgi:hypothetical protein
MQPTSPKNTWNIRITGLVTRLIPNGARVALPPGPYSMAATDSADYRLTREGVAICTFSVREISLYVNERQLKVDGEWP